MLKTILVLCAATLAFGADDPWAKVKELKTGSELRVYKRGSAQPLLVKMGDLTDDNLVVVNKKEETAIPRNQIDRIEARQAARTRTTTDTESAEKNAASDPRSSIPGPNAPPGAMHAPTTTTSTGVQWTKQDFEVVYRRPTGAPKK